MTTPVPTDGTTPPTPSVAPPALNGRALFALIASGVATVANAVTTIAAITEGPEPVAAGFTVTVDPFFLVAWIAVAAWMARAQDWANWRGRAVQHRRSIAWWGWAIPIWNLVAPYRYMSDVASGVSERRVQRWWALWLTSILSGVVGSLNFDGNYEAGPLAAPLLVISWVTLAAAWLLLRGIITATTVATERP